MSKSKGYSLHIGLNSVDPEHYAGWSGELVACEADAKDMRDIAKDSGFHTMTLLTKQATRSAVINAISDIASKADSGDIFFLSNSSHGGSIPDRNGDEIDLQDETWCMYDGQIVDDELFNLFGKFKPKVRILMFSDSCHSGTVAKLFPMSKTKMAASLIARPPNQERCRSMPEELVGKVYRKNKKFYDDILEATKGGTIPSKVSANGLLISGCMDDQSSLDGAFNGLFTGNLLRVWADGAFKGDYRRFHERIRSNMPSYQIPNFFPFGKYDSAFHYQRPFTI